MDADTSKSCVKEGNNFENAVSSSKKKSKKKERKRKYSSSNDNSDSEKEPKKLKSKHKKKCKKRHKHGRDKSKSKHKSSESSQTSQPVDNTEDSMIGPEIPSEILQKAQAMAPVGKKEWEKKQNTIRRVYDEETGRSRLVRGEGEIIEEIVSRERHKEINRQATLGDGQFFQSTLRKKTT